MSDGATQGITAHRALQTILGGEPAPDAAEEQTPEQVRARLMAATADSYGGAADCIARAMLRVLESDESARDLPESGFVAVGEPYVESLWDRARAAAEPNEVAAFDGATGFMAGFAYNQARWILGRPPQPNPAIITIGDGAA